jgi:tRNA(Ile)-lysidine synthetase-like protein
VERGLEWAARGAPGQVDLIHGLRVMVESGWVWVARADAQPGAAGWPVMDLAEACIPVPGGLDLSGGWRLECAWLALEKPLEWVRQRHNPWQTWLDGQALAVLNHGQEPSALRVRRAAPGDRFAPFGMDGRSVKLSDFWINAKLPAPARTRWPLVELGGVIVWAPGFRPAHPVRVTEATLRVLELRLLHYGALPEVSL